MLLAVLATAALAQTGMVRRSFPSPAGADGRTPSVVQAADGRVCLSWTTLREGRHSLWLSTWVGQRWSPPEEAAWGTDWFDNWADFPGLAALEDGSMLVHWLQKSAPDTYSYDAMFRLRRDGAWGSPRPLHDDRTPTEHGFVSAVAAGPESFLAVWLDGRALEQEGPHSGAMRLYQRTVHLDGSLGPELLLDPRVCDCCTTALARREDGRFVALYRDRSPREVRDVSYRMFPADGSGQGDLVHRDGWEIPGCPVNGPQLSSRAGELVATWYTGVGEGGGSVLFSRWKGTGFGPPLDVDDGLPEGRVDVELLSDGSALVAWLEHVDGAAQWRVRRITRDGRRGRSLVLDQVPSERRSGHLRMAPHGRGALLAWQSFTTPGIEVCGIELP